jgi:hypothetical protein
MKICGGAGIAPPFLTLALDGHELSASWPCQLIPQGNNPWYSLDRKLHGHEADVDVMDRSEISYPSRIKPQSVVNQPIPYSLSLSWIKLCYNMSAYNSVRVMNFSYDLNLINNLLRLNKSLEVV